MKKIISLLCVLLVAVSLTACGGGKTPEEVGEYWEHCVHNGELELFYKEHCSDLFFTLNVAPHIDKEEFYARAEKGSDDNLADDQKANRKYVFKSSRVVKDYAAQEVKDYNKVYELRIPDYKENFKDLAIVEVRYEIYVNDVFEKEEIKNLLLGKLNGEWKFNRFMPWDPVLNQ